jgi:hypothetical protein
LPSVTIASRTARAKKHRLRCGGACLQHDAAEPPEDRGKPPRAARAPIAECCHGEQQRRAAFRIEGDAVVVRPSVSRSIQRDDPEALRERASDVFEIAAAVTGRVESDDDAARSRIVARRVVGIS